MIERRIRFPSPRKPAEPSAPPILPPYIIERDDGMFELGWHDEAAGPFETREFAAAVAAQLGRAA